MKIKSIKINQFGKLKNKEINFNNKINIIYGKNEAGKSTILKFIVSMFYGANKNKNRKDISDFDQYEPWSENDFSGKINYELDNKNSYEIFRDFRKKNPKIYDENMTDISKEFNIDKNKGSEFFKEQTGVEEELFYSTVFVEQEKTKLDEKEQSTLIQKITNLVSTGNDNISYKRAIDKLKCKLLEEVGTDRTTEKPINKIDEKLIKMEQEYTEKCMLSEKQLNFEETEKQVNTKINHNYNYVNAIREIKKCKENEKLEKELIKINENDIKNLEEKLKLIKNNSEEKNKKIINKKNKEKNKKIIYLIILLFLILINILLFVFNSKKIINYLFLIIPIFYFIFFIYKIIKENKNNKKINEEEINLKKEEELIEENISDKKTELEHRLNILNQNKNNMELEIKNKYSEINLDNELNNDFNEIKTLLEKTEEKNTELKIKLKEIEIEKKNTNFALEELPNLEEQIKYLKEEKNELNSLANSIQIARQTLEESYDEMKKNTTPQYTQDLSNIINIISNGKYKNVKFTDEEGLIAETESGEYKKVERLSTGTIFQMYLSLRLAIANEITEEKMPIFLDEAFAYYDDERLESVLKYLDKQCEDRQIFIFTCSNREKDLLEKNGIKYDLINI